LGACQSKPEAETDGEINDAEAARDAAIDYLREIAPDNAPESGLSWSEEDITPEGLVGAATRQYTADGLTATVFSPVVAPENIVYTVTISSVQKSWYWQGKVKPDGDITESVPLTQMSEETSKVIAEDFVKSSPTFAYDGMEETLQLTDTVSLSRCPFCWVFRIEFDSRAAGYGDRTGLMLAQVITHHEVMVTVELHEVVTAVMDEQWDMIHQEEIE